MNIQGGRKNGIHWRDKDVTHNLVTGGVFTAANTNRIHRLNTDGTWSSYRPNRAINGFTTMDKSDEIAGPIAGRMYLIDAISNLTFNSNSQLPLWVADDGGEDLAPDVLADDVTPWVFDHGSDKVPNFALFSGIVVNSTQSGNWSSSSTWGGSTPAAGNIVRIRSGHTVTYDQANTSSYKTVSVENGGTLTFSVAANTQLRVQHLLVRETGTLTIGTPGNPVPNGTTAIVEFANVVLDTTNDPSQFGNGLVCLGTLRICGFDRGASLVQASAEVSAGATTITLTAAVPNWQAGDRLIIPDTRQLNLDSGSYATDFAAQHEVRSLSSLSGGNATLNVSVLTYAHGGPHNDSGMLVTDCLFHVFNLTRNVTFRSVDVTGVPGHVVCLDTADVDIRNASFYELARTLGNISLDNTTYSGNTATHIGTNQIGKYPLHLHHVGGRTTPVNGAGYQFYITGCAFDGGTGTTHTRKWGLTAHGSHFGLIQNNVTYNVFGGGHVFEDGSEMGSLVKDNGCVLIRGLGDREQSDDDTTGFARNGAGFWMRSVRNFYQDNVACNCRAYGFILNAILAGNVSFPTYRGSARHAGSVSCVSYIMHCGEFDGFHTYHNAAGLTAWWFGTAAGFEPFFAHGTSPRMVLKNVRCWHHSRMGYWFYESSHIDLTDWQIYGDYARAAAGDTVLGIRLNDYSTRSVRIIGATIHGYPNGVEDPTFCSGYIVFEDCEIRCGVGISLVGSCNAGGGTPSARVQRPRVYTIRNCDLTVTTNSVGVSAGNKKEITRVHTYSAGATNYAVDSHVYVYRRNGNASENYRLYAAGQAAGFTMPPTTSSGNGDIGCPESGLTNAQAYVKYQSYSYLVGYNTPVKSDNPNPNTPGLCVMNAIAPTSATTPSWTNALVEVL